MSATQRGVVFVLTVVTVVVVGVLGVRAIRAPERVSWPGRVAVIGVDESNRRQPVVHLSVADPVRQAVVDVPVDAVVEIPGSGFLRAYHAWRLGGAPLVRDTLARLFGVDVPFSVVGSGTTFEDVASSFTSAEIPSDSVDALRASLERESSGWDRLEVTGERKQGSQGTFVIIDPASVSRAARSIGGLGTKVFVDPTDVDPLIEGPPDDTPTPTAGVTPEPTAAPLATPTPAPAATRIDPGEIQVDVLNGGEVDMAATKTATKLRELGYDVTRVADHEPQDRETSYVYYREGREAEGRQVAANLGYEAKPLESGITIKAAADVVVVLGHDARV